MISIVDFCLWVALPWVLGLIVYAVWKHFDKKWNIPMTILRFTGDKRRPVVFHTRAKKVVVNNCVELKVRGYKRRFRDFIAENYYPTSVGKYGAIIAFEFEDGWLTPLRAAWKKLSKEERLKAEEHLKALQNLTNVTDFEYDKAIHDRLKLEIVDDVDSESYLIDQSRISAQYAGEKGWLEKHQALMIILIVFVALLIGWIVWLQKDPQNAAQQCIASIRDVCRDAWNVSLSNPDFLRTVGKIALTGGTGVPPG